MRHVLSATVLLLAACGGVRSNAEKALAAAESAVAAIEPSAARVLPEDFSDLDATLAMAREAMGRGEYQQVVDGLAGLPERAAEVGVEATAEAARLAEEWTTLAAAMPRNLEAVNARLTRGPLPRGLSGARLQAVRQSYDAAMSEWPAIVASWDSGDLAAAMRQGNALKARVSEAMLAVGLAADERAWGNQMSAPTP